MIDVEDLKDWLSIDQDGSDDDDLLEEIEERAVSILGMLAREDFGDSQTVEKLIDGTGTKILYLPQMPGTPASLELFVRDDDGAWLEVDSTSYILTGRSILMLGDISSIWELGAKKYKAVFTVGFADSDDAPAIVRQAVIDICRYLYREGRQWTVRDLQAGAGVVALGVEKLPNVASVIALYRKPLF